MHGDIFSSLAIIVITQENVPSGCAQKARKYAATFKINSVYAMNN